MSGFAVIGLPDTYIASLGAFLDSFELVRRQVIELYRSTEPMTMQTQIHLLTPDGRPVRLAGGRSLAADGSTDSAVQYDLVHLPGFIAANDAALDARLADARPLHQWLVRQYEGGARLSASGSAVFVLAETGLLNGGVVTVPRGLVPIFRRRYPDIRVDHRATIVEHGRLITANGLAADIQLLTRLVHHAATPELARWLSDVTSQHQATDDQLSGSPLVANAQLWLEERFAQNVRIADLAAAMAVSQQTLLRQFQRHLQLTPQEYLRRLRIRSAQGLLARTSRSISQVASLCGYGDVHSFRKVFREHTGTSPSAYRAAQAGRFSSPICFRI